MEDTADSADKSPQLEDTLTSADKSNNEETRRPIGPTKPRRDHGVSDKTHVRGAEAFRIEAALPELDMSRILDPDRFVLPSYHRSDNASRSGASFSAYDFARYRVSTVTSPTLYHRPPVCISDNFDTLMHGAMLQEPADGDDAEGAPLTDGPTFSHEGLDIYDPSTTSVHVHPNTRAGTIEARCQSMNKKVQHSKKRTFAVVSATPFSCPVRTSKSAKAQLFSAPLKAGINAATLPNTKGGAWTGFFRQKGKRGKDELQDLLDAGFGLVEWDRRTPFLIVDDQGRAIAGFSGCPEDAHWDNVILGATSAMEDAQEHAIRTRLVWRLLSDCNIHRIAGFQSSTFASFAPKLYNYYADILKSVFQHHPNLEHNFDNSIFPACTFNCGPHTCTCRHVDAGNLCYGLCALTAMGLYDSKRGGHLILYSLKLVVEFPPGSTALIPSGAVEHGKTPVGPNETRLSLTQYAVGDLFRWVSYHFQTVASFIDVAVAEVLKQALGLWIEWCRARARAMRWAEKVELLQEEMCRILATLSWKAGWWLEQQCRRMGLDSMTMEGVVAYSQQWAALALKLKYRF
ncbi:hypothetical protein FPV67DRAFT_1670328 [Lyophyllum atratum]|nr:hypothetical protein FPV67DRAFT_1670328 [Lyophyllum atratum]